MAASFFALLDDITTLMDDVATMTKVATKNTVGVLGDDLALNANQLTGLSPQRELPVVWAVVKGSLLNKLILVPVALLLSAFLPSLIVYLLLFGGLFLCFEGAEKLFAWCFAEQRHARPATCRDPIAFEKTKIRTAVRTDFILSAEIVVISLGILQEQNKPLGELAIALACLALLLTFAVYGAVALIVKLDDIGLRWAERSHGALAAIGRGLLWFAPKLLKALTIIGTIAMFVVGGHIWSAHVPVIAHLLHRAVEALPHAWQAVGEYGLEILVGLVIGHSALVIVHPLILLVNKRRLHR